MERKTKISPLKLLFFLSASIFLVSLLLWGASALNPSVADVLNATVCRRIRFALARLTDGFPFSLGEMLLFSLPILAAALAVIAFVWAKNRERRLRLVGWILTVAFSVGSFYPYTLGIGYQTSRLSEKLGLEETPSDSDLLYATTAALLDELSGVTDEIEFSEEGGSVSGMTLDEISKEICSAYETFEADYPSVLSTFSSRAKSVTASEWMSRLHILGVYSFFTGESNVNSEPPDYVLPDTVAHEFAHQRGIAREDEANFIAFLVCVRSENAYVRYSGLLNLFEYVSGAFATCDPERCRALLLTSDRRIYRDIRAYRDYYERYENTVVGEISETVNDTYLKMNGTPGTASYGLVVDLAVAYFAQK